MYIILLKCAYVFDDENSDKFLLPFGNIEKTDKIVLYGAGQCGINLENYIKSVKGNNLVCWVDKNHEFLQKFYSVSNPVDICNVDYDWVVISVMSEKAVNSIKLDLQKLNIPDSKILWVSEEYIKKPLKLLKQINDDRAKML